jgi:hypothetical protein
MLFKKVQIIDRELKRYRFNLRKLNIPSICELCSYKKECPNPLVKSSRVTLKILCKQLKNDKSPKFIYATKRGLDSIDRYRLKE